MYKVSIVWLLLTFAGGCKKYLNEKPDQKLVVPATIQNLQAMLEATLTVNNAYSDAMETSSDNYYLAPAAWEGLEENLRNRYTWNATNLFTAQSPDWNELYGLVYKANIVLDNIDLVEPGSTETQARNYAKGSALFLRANAFLNIAWTWCVAYDASTASTDLGCPLRLSSNFNDPSLRSTLEEMYTVILNDLNTAAGLLPDLPSHPVRPSRAAVYGLLARTHLSMRNYEQALVNADRCLHITDTLMDYNQHPSITPTAAYPFARFNPEVIYNSGALLTRPIIAGIPDSVLYDSYSTSDLRRTLFFRNRTQTIRIFKGNYEAENGKVVLFNGVATDEMFMTRAECLARSGHTTAALDDVNHLLVNRYKTGTFVPLTAASSAEALRLILQERRKELVFRSLRWMDIKRLNKEGYNSTLVRQLNGVQYTLKPGDPRFALALPENVLTITGMVQNPR